MSLFLQGNLYEFLKLTGWRGSKVLYFGDHIYSDLAVSNLLSQNRIKDKAFLSSSLVIQYNTLSFETFKYDRISGGA